MKPGQSPAIRDDFSQKTKNVLRSRAGFRCSFRGCAQASAGPSRESPEEFAIVGIAAHIHAAAPGGPRYLATMSKAQRSSLDNAIWLCPNHATLIDRDESTYTADLLRQMKVAREAAASRDLEGASTKAMAPSDLVAFGPDIVGVGELAEASATEWVIDVDNFVEGDIHALLAYIERYSATPLNDQFVLVNALGDGRSLCGSPSWAKTEGGGLRVRCPIAPAFPRIPADRLGADLALNENHDLDLNWGIVSGRAALLQKIKCCLSSQRGESPFHPTFGAQLTEYYWLYRGTPWFAHLLKLEIVRQAAIPYPDQMMKTQYTPLQCVERVHGAEILADEPANRWLPIRVDLDVNGLGRWQADLSICIPTLAELEEARTRWRQHAAVLSGTPM